jgi:hypothetical protein
MITIFCDFRHFLQKMAFFSKNQCYDQHFSKFSFVSSQKRQFFRQIFWRKYFLNHNIGPRDGCFVFWKYLIWRTVFRSRNGNFAFNIITKQILTFIFKISNTKLRPKNEKFQKIWLLTLFRNSFWRCVMVLRFIHTLHERVILMLNFSKNSMKIVNT